APAELSERIKQVIRNGAPDLGFRAIELLRSLPDASLPDLDQAMAARVEACADPANATCSYTDRIIAGRVLARYAPGAVSARIEAVWKRGGEHWADEARGALLGYLLRVSPAQGAQAARDTLAAARNEPGWRSLNVLVEAASLHMTPALEAALIEAL